MWTDLTEAETYLERGRFDPAEKIARRILKTENAYALREPERYSAAHEVIARAAFARKDYSLAILAWERAVRLHATARNLAGLASCLWPTGQYERRLGLLRRALALEDRPQYRSQIGEMMATLGCWPECFAEYEHRLELPHFTRTTGLTVPEGVQRWMGQPMAGGSIAILHEGGYGDAIHFVRYAAFLRASGAGRIILQAPGTLLGLLRETGLVDEVVDRDLPLPRTDWYIPAQSLPYAHGTTPATVPWPGPYVPGYPVAPSLRGKAVAFVWQGAPHNPTDHVRSADPVAFARFLTTVRAPVRLVSLQFGAEARRLLGRVAGYHRLEWPTVATDWRETRDLLAGVDLLISVDTAMVHLAGAMGVPCWMLVAGSNDWRWMLDRPDTPWYPSVRLYRMRRPNDWAGLLRTVGTDLEARY